MNGPSICKRNICICDIRITAKYFIHVVTVKQDNTWTYFPVWQLRTDRSQRETAFRVTQHFLYEYRLTFLPRCLRIKKGLAGAGFSFEGNFTTLWRGFHSPYLLHDANMNPQIQVRYHNFHSVLIKLIRLQLQQIQLLISKCKEPAIIKTELDKAVAVVLSVSG